MTQTPPQTPPFPALPPELDPRQPPRVPPRTGRRRVARVLSWIAVVTSVTILVLSAGLYAAVNHYTGKLTRIDIRLPRAAATAPAASVDGPAQNFLLVGSDTREAPGTQKGFGAAKGSAKYVAGQRSDTVMLVHIPAGSGKATIVSFPRDSWVEIPAYNGVAAHHQRINSAFSLGGPALLAQVVQNLSGLRVDHYLQINFYGFQRMVNALGGVDLCVKTTRNDQDSKDYLKAGTHHVTGAQALGFVRDRKGLPRGDIDRIADQQYFLSVLLHKVLSTGTLANPLKLNAFLSAAASSLGVDRELTLNDLRTLAMRMRHLDPKHVTLLTAPIKDAGARINGADVVLLDTDQTKALFDSLKGDGRSATAPAKRNPLTAPPAAISVRVYNGAGTAGLATRGTRDLRRIGFAATLAGNRGTGASSSIVQYGAGAAAAARTVVAAVPGATAQPDPSAPAGSVVLVLGSGYTGAHAVTVGSSPSPRPKPPAAPNVTAADAAKSCAP